MQINTLKRWISSRASRKEMNLILSSVHFAKRRRVL